MFPCKLWGPYVFKNRPPGQFWDYFLTQLSLWRSGRFIGGLIFISLTGKVHNDWTVERLSPPELFWRDPALVRHLLVLLLSLQRNSILLCAQSSLHLLPADQSLRCSLAGEVWNEEMGRVASLQEISGGCSGPHSLHQNLGSCGAGNYNNTLHWIVIVILSSRLAQHLVVSSWNHPMHPPVAPTR